MSRPLHRMSVEDPPGLCDVPGCPLAWTSILNCWSFLYERSVARHCCIAHEHARTRFEQIVDDLPTVEYDIPRPALVQLQRRRIEHTVFEALQEHDGYIGLIAHEVVFQEFGRHGFVNLERLQGPTMSATSAQRRRLTATLVRYGWQPAMPSRLAAALLAATDEVPAFRRRARERLINEWAVDVLPRLSETAPRPPPSQQSPGWLGSQIWSQHAMRYDPASVRVTDRQWAQVREVAASLQPDSAIHEQLDRLATWTGVRRYDVETMRNDLPVRCTWCRADYTRDGRCWRCGQAHSQWSGPFTFARIEHQLTLGTMPPNMTVNGIYGVGLERLTSGPLDQRAAGWLVHGWIEQGLRVERVQRVEGVVTSVVISLELIPD